MANTINKDTHSYLIDVENFILRKSVDIKGEESSESYFDDYREVEGLLVPFYIKEIHFQTGQPQEVVLTRYESNPDLGVSFFEPPQDVVRDYEFADGAAAEDISFEFIGNHIFIPATVDCKERLWVLDTGAAVTVVNKAFADEIGLQAEGNLTGRGAGGNVDVSFGTLPPFEVGGIRFQEQVVAVIDMDALIRKMGVEIAGVLGYDFLSRFVTRVDYANELVSFYEPEQFEYTGSGHALDVHMKDNVFEVGATLEGAHSGTWLFDLGAGVTHLDGCYALREGYTEYHGVIAMGHGAGNAYRLKAVKTDGIEFAGYTVSDAKISFAYGGTDTVFTADKIGVLGNSLFRNFVLYVDYGNERVFVEKGEKFGQAWPEDRSGLGLGWTADREAIEVAYVSPATPAERAGFETGDILRSINGIAVEHLEGVIAVRELLAEEPGTRYDFTVSRAGREKKCGLTLKDLY